MENMLYVFTRLYLKVLFITGTIKSRLLNRRAQVGKWQAFNSMWHIIYIYYGAIKITTVELPGELGKIFEMLTKQTKASDILNKV